MPALTRIAAAAALLFAPAAPLPAQTFTKNPGFNNPILLDQSTGYSGAAWIDVQGDGKLDLFVNNSFLYRGNGTGGFVKQTTAIGSGITPATGNGNTWADYDNDGDLDVYIASRNSALYRNDGSGTFALVTDGDIGDLLDNRGWSPAWGDFTGDGNVDLAITHPAGFVPGGPTTNHLFVNDGPPGYGLTRVTSGPIVTGLSSYTVGTWSDFDDDGDLDYFVGAGPANGTTQPDFLYRNLLVETGTPDFERILDAPLGTDAQDGQIWNWIDYDNDGDLDAYLTNWIGTTNGMANRLYRNDGGSFTSITTGAIVTDAERSLSSVWADFDNDGDLDCYVANDAAETDRYYSNNGDGSFTSLTNALTESITHRGASAGDYDNDGDVDLYVDGPSGNRALFRNDTANGNRWIELALTGVASNRSAIGAKVRVLATIGGNPVRQMREVSAQNTFNGQNSLRVHFGLGNATIAETLVVEWPSGIVQTRSAVAVDTLHAIVEDTTTPAVPDGAGVPGTPLVASRSGSDVIVSWDAATCPAVEVNVYHGAIGDFSAFSGGSCGLPPIGTATLPIPGDSWFLVAATDGVSTDGSYGKDSSGAERDVAGAGAACPAIVQHVTNDSCP